MSDSRVFSEIKKLADKDTTYRKLFIRGLGWEMTPETLKSGGNDHIGRKIYGGIVYNHMPQYQVFRLPS